MEEIKLKTRIFSLTVLCVALFGLATVLPATLAAPPRSSSAFGWASLAAPIIDGVDDVFYYPASELPNQTNTGNYYDEIDILNISVSSSDLVITFADEPGPVSAVYNYTILIDNNTDGTAEYCIYSGVHVYLAKGLKIWDIDFYLTRVSDGSHYIPGFGWNSSATPCDWSFSISNELLIEAIAQPIPEINSSRIAVCVQYLGAPGMIYADFAPFISPDSGIPSFSVVLALFGILFLLGFATLVQKDQTRF
jgi:hypothetical protein